MSNHYILQLDTATEICSVSLSNEGKTIDCIASNEPNQHASNLTLFIDELLKRNNLAYTDLCAIAVGMGPGSYTGLRIGVSTAKGLCYSLDLPLIAINTLQIMYEGYRIVKSTAKDKLYVPMLDARRMEVYMAIYDENGEIVKPTDAVIMAEDTFVSFMADEVVLFGSGALKLKTLFENDPKITIEEGFVHSSQYMSAISWEKFNSSSFENLIYFEPYYLKEFIPTTPKQK